MKPVLFCCLSAHLLISNFIWFFQNFLWGPLNLKVTCRGHHSPASAASPPTTTTWWWFPAISEGPRPPYLVPSIPLLPGLILWPLVWPQDPWAPLESANQTCPISVYPRVLQCAFLWLICLFCELQVPFPAYSCPISLFRSELARVGPT